MDFASSYFQLFDLEQAVEIDVQQLASRYRRLQQEFHPDRHAGHSEQDQRLALQYAAHINQAHTVLSTPVSRARYLLELEGKDASDSNLAEDPGFLMAQMMLREELEDIPAAADPDTAVDDFITQREQEIEQLLQEFAAAYAAADWALARQLVSKMQFQSKLLSEAEQLADRLLAD